MDDESELRCLSDVEGKLGEVIFPFEAVVPEATNEWFTNYSASHGTTRELLLISALTSTSALIGKTTVKVFSTYEESGNLFMIAVAPSGSGKSPGCHLGCIDPIVGHIEPKIDTTILMDVTSANGLFNHFVSGSTVPILCIDEAHSFLTKITYPSKSSQVNLTMERLCKCFDGDCWFVLKGNKGKRIGVASARASLLAFTTPRQFLEKAWPRIVNADNGLADRILFMYQKKVDRDLEEMAELSEQLELLPVRSLNVVLEQIFAEHNNDDNVKYCLSASARDAFFKFSKPQDNFRPSQSSAGSRPTPEVKHSNSKRNTQVLRIALNMHILYDRLKKALAPHTGPTERSIDLITMNMAITLVETLETYKGISETVSVFKFRIIYLCNKHVKLVPRFHLCYP